MEINKKHRREDFELANMKSVDRDSVDFNASVTISDGVETYKIPYNGPYAIVPHPDLTSKLDELKPHLAEYFGYNMFENFVNKKDFGATAAQKKLAKEFVKTLLEDMRVTGMAFSGKDKAGVVVKGVYHGSAINTKPLHFTNQEYGEDLEKICEDIENEMFMYFLGEKKAQLEAFE